MGVNGDYGRKRFLGVFVEKGDFRGFFGKNVLICEPSERNFIIIFLEEMFLILVLSEEELSFWSLRRHVRIFGLLGILGLLVLLKKSFLSAAILEEILRLILVFLKKCSCFWSFREKLYYYCGLLKEMFLIIVFSEEKY